MFTILSGNTTFVSILIVGSILVWFYLGEAFKVIATIVIFALSFLFIETLNVGLVILSYSVMLLGNLIGLSILIKN